MRRSILILYFVISGLVGALFGSEIAWERIGGVSRDVRCVLIDPVDPRVIYAGSGSAILKTEDGGLNWRNILLVKGANRGVNFLAFGLEGKDSVYAATGNGLFYTHNAGRNWKRIFRGKDYLENECTALAILPYAIYLGTKSGLFASRDSGRSWQRQAGEMGNSSILAIAYSAKNQQAIYVAAVTGVFKMDNRTESREKIFMAYAVENDNASQGQVQNGDYDEGVRSSQISYIACEPDNPDYLYLATAKAVYRSTDNGRSWDRLSDYGLWDRQVKFLCLDSGSHIYAGTKQGIFKYEKERWQELSFGLVTQEIRSFTIDKEGHIYAACANGLFKAGGSIRQYPESQRMDLYLQGEPTIAQVQRAAIQYAEVDLRKIKEWRRQAAKKAYLPTVSASVSRDAGDLWHWESGSTTKSGDDVLVKGRDTLDWGLTFSWDLGELVWNNDQTSIDVRSRLMVELRDEILDEVNKTYFERLRVKAELDSLAIEDKKKYFEKELRLKELTASLDALSGGYFSSQIK